MLKRYSKLNRVPPHGREVLPIIGCVIVTESSCEWSLRTESIKSFSALSASFLLIPSSFSIFLAVFYSRAQP